MIAIMLQTRAKIRAPDAEGALRLSLGAEAA
jgi:hypothetical protein